MGKKKPVPGDVGEVKKPPVHQSDETADSFSRCPVCGADYKNDPLCEHLVSWDYGEEGGNWPGQSDPWKLYKVANELLDDLSTRFTEEQLDVLRMLLNLPSDLLPALAKGIKEGQNYTSWTDLIGELIVSSPDFVDSALADNEPSGPGTAGMWTNYWVRNAKACGRLLDKKVNGYTKALQKAAKAVSQLSEMGDGNGD